jgi:hypothetical protein
VAHFHPFAAFTILLCFAPVAARAAVISGGPTALLSQTSANQLETWLNGGNIQLAQIYDKQTGHTSNQFHAAVDGQGRTFTLIEVLAGTVSVQSFNAADLTNIQGSFTDTWYDANGQSHTATVYYGTTQISRQIIGGYDPQSWSTINNYNYSLTNAERTAFLFNLTSSEIQRQNLIGQGVSNVGQYQTYNNSSYGPTFGGGHDLYVSNSLNNGHAFNYSYGGTSRFNNILAGGAQYDNLQFGKIEVFAIAESEAVPEPASLAIWGGIGLAGLVAARRRKKFAV